MSSKFKHTNVQGNLRVKKIIVERYILIDDAGLRQSTWFQTNEDAEQELKRINNERL